MSAMHYLKTKRRPTETVHFAEAQTGYGTVDLESHDEEGLRAVLRAIDEYETILDQRDALVGACEQLMAWIGPPLTDRASYDSAREVAWSAARDALALVRGEDV